MKQLLSGLLVCFAVVSSPPNVQADDAPLDVVKKGIKAYGGKAAIEKFQSVVMEGKGTVIAMGMKLKYSAVWSFSYPHRIRTDIDAETNGMSFKVVNVYTGKEGWQKIGDMKTMNLTEPQLVALKVQMQVDVASRLVPLLDKEKYSVSSVGKSKVNGKDAIGLNITNKTGLDANFYFDTKTFLLIKQEYQTKNETGKEVTQTVFLSGFKKVKGVSFPTKLDIKQDGKNFVTAEFEKIELKQKLDDSLFKKP